MTNPNIPMAPIETQIKYKKKKNAFEVAFKEFHTKVFNNKVLDSNKSIAVKKTELQLINNVFKTALSLDEENYGEGMLALITTMVRELLTLRDRNNELECELYKTIRDVKALKEQSNGK